MAQLGPLDQENINEIAFGLMAVAAELRQDPTDAFNTEVRLESLVARLTEISTRVSEVSTAAISELHRG